MWTLKIKRKPFNLLILFFYFIYPRGRYPSDEYRGVFLRVLLFNMCSTFLWDRLMLFLFARHIFKASLRSITVQVISPFSRRRRDPFLFICLCVFYFIYLFYFWGVRLFILSLSVIDYLLNLFFVFFISL